MLIPAVPFRILVLIALLAGCSGKASPARPAAEASRVAWVFEQPERGAIIAGPVVTAERVYVAAIQDAGLVAHGSVCCLDRQTRKVLWKFDDDGGMQHMYSTPCLADGRLYVGEGMHANFVCKLYCLDAATGKKLWDFETAGHIESSPCVASGKVYFGSGDDGLYCLDALTGAKVWHYKPGWAALHIDANPLVVDGRLYAGSGVSRRCKETEVFCLNADNGSVLWRVPTELPAWGSPAAAGGHVYFGLGNGRLVKSVDPPEKPRGAVLGLEAATGKRIWQYDVGDGVLVRPAVDAERVYFGSRDAHCYAVDRREGRLLWRTKLGSPVVAAPALADGRLYVAASDGQVSRLDPRTGAVAWTFDLAGHTKTRPRLFSAPAAVLAGDERRVYFGAELQSEAGSVAALYGLRD